MALHVGLRRAVPPAAIVGYSGMLVLKDDTDVEGYAPQVRARPPVLLLHGDADDLIPVQALILSSQALAALEIPVEWHISEPASATASTTKACATAANFSPGGSKSRVTT